MGKDKKRKVVKFTDDQRGFEVGFSIDDQEIEETLAEMSEEDRVPKEDAIEDMADYITTFAKKMQKKYYPEVKNLEEQNND